MAKNTNVMLAIVLIAVALLAASMYGIVNFNLPSLPGSVTNPVFPTPAPTPASGSDMVAVTKSLKLVFQDALSGTGFPLATTNAIKIYDSTGKVYQEQCTISSGATTTSNTYTSGTVLQIRYYHDTTNDEYMWWTVTVPSMSRVDAEALTVNTILLKGTGLCSLTDQVQHSNSTLLTDGSVMNTTQAPTGTFTYSWFVANDNTGFMTFTDPTYSPAINCQAMVVVKLSGTGYENIAITGYDGVINSGTTRYYYKLLPTIGSNSYQLPSNLVPTLSKVKQGNDYVVSGSGAVTFGYSAVGYTGDSVTMQLYVYAYADPAYLNTFGAFGPYAVQLAEQTITVTV